MEHNEMPSRYPNLPVSQRLTQWLVDQFNDDEATSRQVRERLLRCLPDKKRDNIPKPVLE